MIVFSNGKITYIRYVDRLSIEEIEQIMIVHEVVLDMEANTERMYK